MKHLSITILLFLSMCSAVQAEKFLLVIGEWAPYTSEHLEGYGMMTEIVSAVFQDMGQEVEFQFYPWSRCLQLVMRGKAWGTFPYLITETRLRRILYSAPIGESTMKLFYYDATQEYRFNEWKDLGQYRLGGIQGYFYEEVFEAEEMKVNYSIDTFSGLRKLKSGRIDVLIEDEAVGWRAIASEYPDEIEKFGTVEKPFHVGPLYLFFSQHLPGSQELLAQFNRSLEHIKENGTYGAIAAKYQHDLSGDK